MATIDGLFEQIIHSEKVAHQRKTLLQELRQDVFTAQEKGKELEKRFSELREILKAKLDELSRHDLTVKWLSSQEQIYRDQKQELTEQLQTLREAEREHVTTYERDRLSWCEKMSGLAERYGLSGAGRETRHTEQRQQLHQLMEEMGALQAELQAYKEKEAVVVKCREERDSVRTKLEKLQEDNKKLASSLCTELQMTEDLEAECQSISDHLNTDQQFISLQQQLDEEKHRSTVLGSEGTQLQSELNQLHQQLWQHQLKQRQQQMLQQKQQQQQQWKHEHNRKVHSGKQHPNTTSNGSAQVSRVTQYGSSCVEINNEVFSDSDDLLDSQGHLTEGQLQVTRNNGDYIHSLNSNVSGNCEVESLDDPMLAESGHCDEAGSKGQGQTSGIDGFKDGLEKDETTETTKRRIFRSFRKL
ncbi:putative uncharacterized protein DDB_G0271606 [Mya arenaria]|uniref:putative uncharacterized protein DDB_G0271606 n=1 Tax=Mya arenaria TaxID=6604 RepID=UPI0022E22A65|nr:putative uncharacterized protein DDB_G0271606 [Mya arenaria]